MDIRIRRHNDNPDWAVCEWIKDGETVDDAVCDNNPGDIIGALSELITYNHGELNIDYEELI